MHFIDDYSFAGQPRLQPDRTSPKFFTKERSFILRLATATPRIEDPSIRNSKIRGSFVYSKSDSPSKHDMMFSEATSIVLSVVGSDRLPFGLALLHIRKLVNRPALTGPTLVPYLVFYHAVSPSCIPKSIRYPSTLTSLQCHLLRWKFLATSLCPFRPSLLSHHNPSNYTARKRTI